jgi:histidinol-phosphate aminotransferase
VWLPGGVDAEAYMAIFAEAGLMVLAYASGDDWDGLRITVGEPVANARVLEIAATLPRQSES